MGNFVIWRDHDLMWNSEKTVMKYGPEPYPHAVQAGSIPLHHLCDPQSSSEAQTRGMVRSRRRRQGEKNTYDFSGQGTYTNIKESLDIRASDVLIARTTVSFRKNDRTRDIYLVHRLNALFARNGSRRRVYLAVAGDPHEHPGLL